MNCPRLNLVVAACNNGGIGINGQLPWRLRKDLDFFKTITTQTNDPNKQNAVIMGRKTWFSIPAKVRPLRNRINIVLSRELKEVPDGVYIARSLPEALQLLNSDDLSPRVENIHIIGGSSVYQEAMTGQYSCRLYLTRVLASIECDTFLPEVDEKVFHKVESCPDVPEGVHTENNLKFQFEVYDKAAELSQMDLDLQQEPFQFDIMAAMCDGNRGIAYNMRLPWPPLKEDYRYYTSKLSTVRTPGKKSIEIRGRRTWDCCQSTERSHPNVLHIIVSRTLTECTHPNVYGIVQSFPEALQLCNTPPLKQLVDHVWVVGGSSLYQEALQHPLCRRLYLTRIYKDFPSDTFFPRFEDDGLFKEISNSEEDSTVIEENDIKYEFKIYEKLKIEPKCNMLLQDSRSEGVFKF